MSNDTLAEGVPRSAVHEARRWMRVATATRSVLTLTLDKYEIAENRLLRVGYQTTQDAPRLETTNRPMTPLPSDETEPGANECAGCELPASRRRFLRDAFLSVASALVAVGASRTSAFSMPLEFIEGKRRGGQTVSYPIPTADGAQIDKRNDVILVRSQGAVYAFDLSCPHQNTALRWSDGDHEFECPKHHSRFQPNGDYIADSGRATRNMDRFAVARTGDDVTVDLDKLYQDDSDGTEWAAAVIKLS